MRVSAALWVCRQPSLARTDRPQCPFLDSRITLLTLAECKLGGMLTFSTLIPLGGFSVLLLAVLLSCGLLLAHLLSVSR